MSNDITKVDEERWEIMERQADVLVKSRILPTRWDTKEKVLAGMLYARDLRIPPMTLFQNCYSVDGKLSMEVNLLEALAVQRSALTLECKESTSEKAVVVGHRQGWADYAVTFTIDDAKRAGLTNKTNWRNYPRQMLMARAKAEVLRFMGADCTSGIACYTPEELGADKAEKPVEAKVLEAPPFCKDKDGKPLPDDDDEVPEWMKEKKEIVPPAENKGAPSASADGVSDKATLPCPAKTPVVPSDTGAPASPEDDEQEQPKAHNTSLREEVDKLATDIALLGGYKKEDVYRDASKYEWTTKNGEIKTDVASNLMDFIGKSGRWEGKWRGTWLIKTKEKMTGWLASLRNKSGKGKVDA
jgi:hypothetical protein